MGMTNLKFEEKVYEILERNNQTYDSMLFGNDVIESYEFNIEEEMDEEIIPELNKIGIVGNVMTHTRNVSIEDDICTLSLIENPDTEELDVLIVMFDDSLEVFTAK